MAEPSISPRFRRFAGAGVDELVRVALAEAPDWEPEHSALLVVRSFAESDESGPEIAAVLAEHPDASATELATACFEDIALFTYLRSLPSMACQHIVRALGGAASACAITNGWDAARATARRLLATDELHRVLLVGARDGFPHAESLRPAARPELIEVALDNAAAITPLGDSLDETWAAACAGHSGLRPAPWLAGLPAAPVLGSIEPHRPAATLARDVALAALPCPSRRVGLVVAPMWAGPGGGDPGTWAAQNPEPELDDLGAVLAHQWGVDVESIVLEAACAGGVRALIEACRMVRLGEVEQAIAVGVVARNNPYVVSQFAQLTALSRWSGTPATASRPFDVERAGMVMGEAAVAVVVTKAETDDARVRVHGHGLAVDADHPTAPSVASIERCLRAATASIDDIDVVSAHGTGTALNDAAEAAALHHVLGEVPTTALKALTGHASSASGLLEVALLARTMTTGLLPGVPTCTQLDPELALAISPQLREVTARAGLSPSFGFGGQYAAVALTREP